MPVGLDTWADAVGEDTSTLEDVYEPYFIQQGLMARTQRGRRVPDRSSQHQGLTLSGF